jgi:hypothetical protein
VFAHFHYDIVMHEPPGCPTVAPTKAKPTSAPSWSPSTSIGTEQLVADDILDADLCVIIRAASSPPSAAQVAPVEQPYLELLRLKDGKAIQAWVHMYTADVNSLVPLPVS